jgi:hypothetical protein
MYEGTGMRYKNGEYYWIKKHKGQTDWEIGRYVDSGGAFYPGLTDNDGRTHPGFILVGTRIGIFIDEVYKIGPVVEPPGEG